MQLIPRPIRRNPDRYDFVEQGTRADILENKVTLVCSEGNPKGIESFDDLAKMLGKRKF